MQVAEIGDLAEGKPGVLDQPNGRGLGHQGVRLDMLALLQNLRFRMANVIHGAGIGLDIGCPGDGSIALRFYAKLPKRAASGRQHDLADMGARFHQPMGVGGLAHREGAVDLRFDRCRVQSAARPRLRSARAISAFSATLRRPQRRAGEGQPLDHQRQEVDLDLRAFEEGDVDDAAVHRRAAMLRAI